MLNYQRVVYKFKTNQLWYISWWNPEEIRPSGEASGGWNWERFQVVQAVKNVTTVGGDWNHGIFLVNLWLIYG